MLITKMINMLFSCNGEQHTWQSGDSGYVGITPNAANRDRR